MNKIINQQTPGPVFVERDQIETDGGESIASVCGPNASARRVEKAANRRLIASAYTAFDRAGRELGIDASELAQSIDLAALIRAARSVVNQADSNGCTDDLTVTGAEAVADLGDELTKLPPNA